MMDTRSLYLLCLILTIIAKVCGQNEICHFYGLNADCRYRVDLICLSHITAEIDPCTDPLEVNFRVTCTAPRVDFSHTFSSSDTTVSVPGYQKQVFLQVKMKTKPEHVLNIEADIHVYGQASVDFINHDVKMAGYSEKCPGLNEAAKIAVGVMGGLTGIAVCLVIVLLYIRYNRRKKLQQRPSLVENSEDPGQSTPRQSRNFDNYDGQAMDNSVNSNSNELNESINRNDYAINESINSENVIRNSPQSDHVTPAVHHMTSSSNTDQRHDGVSDRPITPQTEHLSTDRENDDRNTDGENNVDRMRYSDILNNQKEVPFKISDC